MSIQDERIQMIREFNRFFTRKIGVLREGLLHSSFSLTEARIIFELANQPQLTASDLMRDLGLDGGYLSRLLSGLAQREIIEKTPLESDRRQLLLHLTAAGQEAYAVLDGRSREEIGELLNGLSDGEQRRLIEAMVTIEEILTGELKYAAPFFLRPHQPGDMGWVIQAHGRLYHQTYGWDQTFESFVAQICADFMTNFDPQKERCWIAEMAGEPVGSVFCVNAGDGVAKLRMLIVDPKAQGLGLGTHLVEACIRFARESGYHKLTLWTNSILVEARHIYEKLGFILIEEEHHTSFGQDLIGEYWELSF